jgi:hypothetical protein
MGPVTLLLVACFLSPTEQGFYYTFWSIIAAQVFFELGLGNVLLFYAAHEKARLDWQDGRLVGDEVALSRLASIFHKALRFCIFVAIGVFAVILPVGYWILSQEGGSGVNWRWPWLLMGAIAPGLLVVNTMLYLLEGCGLVEKVSKVRLFSGMSMSVAMWATLIFGGKLFAAAAANLGAFGFIVFWLWKYQRAFLRQIYWEIRGGELVAWFREIWPMQWKSAVSFVNGYLMFQLFNPILFYFDSPISAGKMGMSANLVGAGLGISIAWINTKAAMMCALVAERRWSELDRLFLGALARSTGVLVFIFLLIYLGLHGLLFFWRELGVRFLDPEAMAWLMVAVLANHVLFSYAVYLRAHKHDPLMWLTIVGAILMPCGTILAVKHGGVLGVTQVYAALTWVLGIGGGTIVFLRKRALWHKNAS